MEVQVNNHAEVESQRATNDIKDDQWTLESNMQLDLYSLFWRKLANELPGPIYSMRFRSIKTIEFLSRMRISDLQQLKQVIHDNQTILGECQLKV